MKITSIFNLQSAATEMDIMYKLEMALIYDGNLVSASLKKAIHEKKPASLIISTCYDMIVDNRAAMCGLLGTQLCDKIVNYTLS